MRDFRYDILQDTAHRPWPMPAAPWVMTQTWRDLLFAHWPIDESALRARVPPQLPIDRFDGRAWVGIVPFEMTNVAPRLMGGLPRLSAFSELNVRTYVTVGGRPGVYFFSLDANNPFAVWTARAAFRLPYFAASMAIARSDDRVVYRSRRTSSDARFEVRYHPTGPSFAAPHGSFEYFLAERYCLYTVDRHGRPSRTDIHHSPWNLQRAEADISVNTMATAAGLRLPAGAPHLLFARRQDTVAWLPRSGYNAAHGG